MHTSAPHAAWISPCCHTVVLQPGGCCADCGRVWSAAALWLHLPPQGAGGRRDACDLHPITPGAVGVLAEALVGATPGLEVAADSAN